MQQDMADSISELLRIKAQCDKVQLEKQIKLDAFYRKVKEMKDRIEQVRNEMNQLFDSFLLQIDLQKKSLEHALTIATNTCAEIRGLIENQIQAIQRARVGQINKLSLLNESQNMCKISKQTLNEIGDENIKCQLTLSHDERLPRLVENIYNLRQPAVVESDEVPEVRHKEISYVNEGSTKSPFLNPVSVTPTKEAYIRVRNDEKLPLISGCCLLPDGCVFLCDNSNKKLKILDKNLNVKFTVPCINSPFDVALVDVSACVITIPDSRSIQFVTVNPGFKFKHTKYIKLRCFGIDVHDNKMFVCIDDLQESVKCVKILTLDADCLSYISHLGPGSPRYLCVNEDGTKICYTGGLDKTMFINCVTKDGYGVFALSSEILHSPKTVLAYDDGNILVMDDKERCLQTISYEGEFAAKITLDKVSSLEPTSFCFSGNKDIIIVSSVQANISKVVCYKFNLEKQ